MSSVDLHKPATSASDSRRIALSLGLFESNVDTEALSQAMNVASSPAITPLMFEHRLLARARADKRRIVLPEGNDDRILRAAERILQRDVCHHHPSTPTARWPSGPDASG